jgi:plasmid stability protein
MPQLVIPDLDERTWERLRQRAARHACSTEVEAQQILAAAMQSAAGDPWAAVNALRDELAQSGREFPDSTLSVQEDRGR